MATMNVSVTDKMRAWVEAQVADGRYATASDCVRDLIRVKMEAEEKLAKLRVMIQEGIDSGVSERSWEELLDEMKQRAAGMRAVG